MRRDSAAPTSRIKAWIGISILTVVTLVVTGFIWVSRSRASVPGAVVLSITAARKEVLNEPLPVGEKAIEVEGPLGVTHVLVRDGQVCVTDSACPNHTCSKVGWISRPGQIIVCLPNEVVVRLDR